MIPSNVLTNTSSNLPPHVNLAHSMSYAGATWYGTLSGTLIPVDPETDSNGTIQFEVRSDTAIIGDIGMQATVSGTRIND
jgi:hypothetical protein